MGRLAELILRTSYHRGRDDIAAEFYLPCMARADEYDRAVGYFRSTAFLIAWKELRGFVARGGTMRVLCSQVLAQEDIDALARGYEAKVDETIAARLLAEVRSALEDDTLREPTRILAALVARGTLHLQIAILRDADLRGPAGRIFHDKLGIFRDAHRNVVMFKGSMNETWTGLANDGNLESVDVAASWMGARDLERVRTEEEYFASLWSNNYPTLTVRPFPEVAREELVGAASADWEADLERALTTGSATEAALVDVRGRSLKPHQAAGLASWQANGRRGILAFATGSGKTFTAITAIREAIRANEVVVVLVPDRVLFAQWYEELAETTRDFNASILRAGSGYNRWRETLRLWTMPGERPRIVLATMRTAVSPEFRAAISAGSHLVLVADEVHRLGSPENRTLLDDQRFGARLGLSATPERAGDPVGTASLLTFFNGILTPRYTLADAVRDGVLCRYFYRPHVVEMTHDEKATHDDLSGQVAVLRARIASGDKTPNLDVRLQHLYIKRARIAKHASGKIPLAVSVLTAEYQRGQRWIVYCDDLAQLDAISSALLVAGIQNMPFHSQMEGDREATLRWLSSIGGVVVAIKCLDEGVDIPNVTHALILASSKNPREFIQRRGRVLRTAQGKGLAYIHDAIVVPPIDQDQQRDFDPILSGELARAVEFAQHAENPASAADLQQIAIDAGIEWRTMLSTGVEDADE